MTANKASGGNPALRALVDNLQSELAWAQVWIRRVEASFELRHLDDLAAPNEALRTVALEDLRALAQRTESEAFRPLKSAPNLKRGWRVELRGEDELERALHHLYPGALADWHAAKSSPPPVTHYREFTARQTGMYRITQKLADAQASFVIQACCHRSFCLKRRLWSVHGLDADSPETKSVIPCLEPCAILLEFARKAMRIEQEEKTTLHLAPSELQTLREGLERAMAQPRPNLREADFSAVDNPRRLQWLLAKLKPGAAEPGQSLTAEGDVPPG